MTDSHAAHDLRLFIDNDGALYASQTTPILKNLATKRARGQYRHDLAVKLFGYLVEAGAKKYVNALGDSAKVPWHKMFNVSTRRRVAEELTKSFETEAALGNYDNLLPEKYQKQKTHHATICTACSGNHRKKPAELDREIKQALALYRGKR